MMPSAVGCWKNPVSVPFHPICASFPVHETPHRLPEPWFQVSEQQSDPLTWMVFLRWRPSFLDG